VAFQSAEPSASDWPAVSQADCMTWRPHGGHGRKHAAGDAAHTLRGLTSKGSSRELSGCEAS
jgi:hypothetical protein